MSPAVLMLCGTVDIFAPAASTGKTPGGPVEHLSFHGEFQTADGLAYVVETANVDGATGPTTWMRGQVATWLAERCKAGGHDGPDEIYQFADEQSLAAAVGLLHRGAVNRTDLRVVASGEPADGYRLRRLVVYRMVDSIWMLEHIRPGASGLYLRLRSTGQRALEAHLEDFITPEARRTSAGSSPDHVADQEGSGLCSSRTTDV